MTSKLFAIAVALVTLVTLSGCGTIGQNLALGTAAGAAIGNLAADNREGTAIGATAGFVMGGIASALQNNNTAGGQSFQNAQQKQCWQIAPNLRICCNAGDSLVTQNGNPTCKRGGNNATFAQQISIQGLVCGPAQFSMSCPSVQVSGTDCRRCQ